MVCHSLELMNWQPTKFNSLFDVFLTNQPLSVSSVKVLAGISDHEAILVKSDMSVKNSPTIKRKSYFWGKADFSAINHLIGDFTTTFLNHPIDTPVQLV